MKILLAGYILGKGGIQSHFRWLAKALSEEGIQTLVLSLGIDKQLPDNPQILQNLRDRGIRINLCTAYPDRKNFLTFNKIQRLFEIKTSIDEFSPDIYLAVGTGWNLFVPSLLSNSKPRRIFHEVMSGVPCGWKDSRWCVRGWFDEVVGQSPKVAQTFSRCFGWKKSVSALPAIPEPLELTASLPIVSNKTVPIGKAKAALFSRLVPHKQAFWLVQQWDLLKDYLAELHIHGSGLEEPLIRDYVVAKGIEDRVKCFGRYPEGQAYVDLLSSYDLTLLPTIGAEGAPLVLLESMACGVPFVAYGVGGIPDYGVNNSNCTVVNPNEPSKFITAVREMTYKLAQSQIFQTEIQQYYLTNYSFDVLKKAWLSYLLNDR